MKIYFIRRNNDSIGPLSLEELKSHNLTKDEFVWKEGLADWIQAKNLSELNDLFTPKVPPPFIPSNNSNNGATTIHIPVSSTEKVGFKLGRLFGWRGLLIIAIIATIVIYNTTNSSPTYLSPFQDSIAAPAKTPEQLRAELIEQERQNPAQYLTDETTMRTNLIGEKVIEGTVINTASVATFKDIILQVDFLSKTEAVISSKRFTVYEVLVPKQSARFKFKTFAPYGTDGFSASIIDAATID